MKIKKTTLKRIIKEATLIEAPRTLFYAPGLLDELNTAMSSISRALNSMRNLPPTSQTAKALVDMGDAQDALSKLHKNLEKGKRRR